MSKSANNYIGIQEAPDAMFRKVMQIDDDAIFKFFELLSALPMTEINQLRQSKAAGRNPIEIKAIFAREMVARFHGPGAAERAAVEFNRVSLGDAAPAEVPEVVVHPQGGVAELAWAIKQANLAASTNEARRLVEQGGVEVDGTRVTDPKTRLEPGRSHLVRVGSKNRRFARIRVVG